jgi:hypothetical protein
MIGLVIGAIAPLVAGPLADYVFEPSLASGGWLTPLLGDWVGSGPGAGMALLYVLMALWMVAVGIGGYAFYTLRNVETLLPDHESTPPSVTIKEQK